MWTPKAAGHLTIGVVAMLLALMTGSLGLSLLGLLLVFSVVVAYLVQRRVTLAHTRKASADRLREKDSLQVAVQLKGTGLGTGFIEVRDRLDERLNVTNGSSYRIVNMPRGRSESLEYELKTPIRGIYPLGPIEVRKTDMYELFYNTYEVPKSVAGITVLPRADEVKEAKIKSLTPKILSGVNPVRQPGIGSQFYALREYTSADPMKDVNWKASARAGELIVNQWERESISIVTLMVDARAINAQGTLGGNPFLYNCRAAATMAEMFIGDRNTVRFLHYGNGVHSIQPDSGERQLYKILEKLAEIEPKGEQPLSDVVHEVLPQLAVRSPVVIFTSLEDDPSVYEAVSMLMARDLYVLLIVPSAPDFLRLSEEGLDSKEYEVRRVRHQMEVKRLRGLGVRVVLWEPEDRLELAFMGSIVQ